VIRLFFLIRSLDPGGAERQLIELVKGLDKKLFSITVATFYDGGALRLEVDKLEGIRIISLKKKGRWDALPFFFRLLRDTRKMKPDIIHGYMGIANELSLLLGKILHAKVVWGARSSNVDFSRYDWAARWSFKIGAYLSSFPDLIIVNSWAGQKHHIAHGYSGKNMVVIPNGIDIEYFKPFVEERERVRTEWSVEKKTKLIGLIARLDPMKDHKNFLHAAALLIQKRQDVKFVCVGDGPPLYKHELMALSESLNLGNRLICAGTRRDMPAVYNALDIATLCSYGEGFPNVIGEAMACGVPCVVTDAGDSARIVSETGVVVSPRDPTALFHGFESCLARLEDPDIHQKCRQRIVQEFSQSRMVNSTTRALESLL